MRLGQYRPAPAFASVAPVFLIFSLTLFSTCRRGTGGTGAVDLRTAKSISQTPPSSIYPSDCNEPGRLDYNIAGTEALPVTDWRNNLTVERRRIELRGWLVHVPNFCHEDGDAVFNLEVDPSWTDQIGVDLNQLIRVGNVLLAKGEVPRENVGINFQHTPATYYQAVSPPVVHLEIYPWIPSNFPCAFPSAAASAYFNAQCNRGDLPPLPAPPCPAATPPPDWIAANAPTLNRTSPNGSPGPCDLPPDCNRAYFWPYHPRQPSPCLAPGQYVRVVGTLITDYPHFGGLNDPPKWVADNGQDEDIEVKRAWGGAVFTLGSWLGGDDVYQQNHPARYTEVHPVDLIAVLDTNRRSSETVVVVAVLAEDGAQPSSRHPPQKQTFDLDITPPARAAGATGSGGISVVEKVDQSASDLSTIKVGNDDKTGARIEKFADHVHIHIEIEGKSTAGAKGRFKAIYRVRWQD